MVSRRSQFVSRVLANLPICREHYRLVVGLEFFPPARPGQFVQVACRDLNQDFNPERETDWTPGQRFDLDGRELMSPLAMLRRPFSLADRRDAARGVELDLIHRVVGTGTDWLSHLRPGEKVHLLGPLGNHFHPPSQGAAAILIGGGVGIPPMLYLASVLKGRAVAFCGALSRDLLPLTIRSDQPVPSTEDFQPHHTIEEFARHDIPAVVTTDDGSYGFRGFVTQALERYLDSTLGTQCLAPVLYTCGPEPMMKRVAEIAAARGLECQIAVERAMACGMGTCQSCCIKVRKPDPAKPPLPGSNWCYRLACTDGPVFRGSELLW